MSKSILNNLINQFPNNAFLSTSSVWSYYNSGSYTALIKNTKSNLHSTIVDLIKNKKTSNGITIFVGAKGRSQHSETQLIILDGDCGEFVGAYFTHTELLNLALKKGV